MRVFAFGTALRDAPDLHPDLDPPLAAGGDALPGKKDGGAASTGADPLYNERGASRVAKDELAR